MNKAIIKSFKDIFSADVIGFILKIALSSFVVMFALFWFFWENFSSIIEKLASHAPLIGGYEWFQHGIAIIASPFLAYGIILSLLSILTSIYSPKLLINLAKKNYGIDGKDNSKMSEVISVNLKATLKFFAFTILLLPLLFIPIVGQIIMLFLWAILIKEPTSYDIKSLFNVNSKYSKSLWATAFIAATFNYIPILNIFSALFAQILFMHLILTHNLKK